LELEYEYLSTIASINRMLIMEPCNV